MHPPQPRYFRSDFVFLGSLVLACAPGALAQGPLPADFVEVTKDSLAPDYCGVNFVYHPYDGNQVDAGGFAVADYDNDGDLDIFIPDGRNFPNKLYRNNGNGTFTDVAAQAGVQDDPFAGSGALFLDYDNDGDYDIFVVASPGNINPTMRLFHIFENEGSPNWNFLSISSTAGFRPDPNTPKSTMGGFLGGVAAGDYNLDGYLDVISTYFQAMNGQDQMRLFKSLPSGLTLPGQSKRFFKDFTLASGLAAAFPGETWQPTFVDINRDGFPDIHIAMDFDMDLMLINQQNGTFVDVATPIGMNGNPPEGRDEMGVSFADYDNDGDLDMHTTNMAMMMMEDGMEMMMGMDRFYRNDSTPGALAFVDVAMEAMADFSAWGWGDIFFDFDNDGDLDHATVSGFKNGPWYNTFHINEYPMKGDDGITVMLEDRSADVPDFTKFGMDTWRSSRGLAAFDYDGDGDLDLAVSCHPNAPINYFGVFKNTLANGSHWLEVDLYGPANSRNVAGAWVSIGAAGVRQLRNIMVGSSFITQEPERQHFGLGAASPDWLVVRWLDGTVNYLLNPGVDQIKTVHKSADMRGDMNGDGLKNCTDVNLLQLMLTNPTAYHNTVGNFPGEELGDMNGDGVVDTTDLNLLKAMTGC
ncbi:MAG: VCBS repeat-containing protein [Planctomycetes bacterium]|nr:VCBS repeat-containing protein [Planctomycetota bacterium]